MHVTFSFALSSTYDKPRISSFIKAVQQHTEGMVESSILLILLEIYFHLAVKKFKKFVRNCQSYCREFGVLLFGTQR